MTKINTISITILMVLFLFGCASKTCLESGIVVSDSYVSLYTTYNDIYNISSDNTKELMKTNIAPQINKLKYVIINYNKGILLSNSNSTTDKNTLKLEIIQKITDLYNALEEIKKNG